jgi:ABC-type branched-subunit amino acid transport system substrate-binding protein
MSAGTKPFAGLTGGWSLIDTRVSGYYHYSERQKVEVHGKTPSQKGENAMCTRIVLASVALLGITTASAGAITVKIGFINSFTGPEAPIGENLSTGVALAVEDLARKGIKVELVKEDDVGKPQISMSAMEKLATRDNVMGVVGPYTSACANAVAKVAEKYKVPLLVPVASKEEITRQGLKWLFRLSATTNDYASILLDMVTTFGKPKTIGCRPDGDQRGVRGVLFQGIAGLPFHPGQDQVKES